MKTANFGSRIVSFALSLLISMPFMISEELLNGLQVRAAEFQEGYYFIQHTASGKLVDVTDMSTENGMQLQLYDKYQFHTNQVFKFEHADGGYWKITSLYSGKAVEVRDSKTKNNAEVAQWDYGNIECQQWEIITLDSDNVALKNRNSGLLLNTYQAKSNNGTKLVQYEQNDKNKAAQTFCLIPLAIGAEDAKTKRIENERACYDYLKDKNINNGAISGVLASMYDENKFVFGSDALDFYWNSICGEGGIYDKISSVPEDEYGAASVAYDFTYEKQKRFFNSLYAATHNSEFHLRMDAIDTMSLAKNGFWPVYGFETLIWPTPENHEISSFYGERIINGKTEFHAAIDIRGYNGGQPVLAAASGIIIQIDDRCTDDYGKKEANDYYDAHPSGKCVVIQHDNGYCTVYNHLRAIDSSIREQGTVVQGQQIGTIGSTGRSSGPHLDFGIHTGPPGSKGSTHLNPKEQIGHLVIMRTKSNPAYTYVEKRRNINSNSYSSEGGEVGGTSGGYKSGIYLLKAEMNLRSSSNTSVGENILCVIPAGSEIEVSEVKNGLWGRTIYNGRSGWVNIHYSYATFLRPLDQIKKPGAPSLSLVSPSDDALNAISTVSWNAVDGADTYTVTVYDETGTEVVKQTGITATSTSFTLNEVGIYTVKAVAVNSKYTSDVSEMAQKITVHPNVTVTFVNDDGSELSKQSVIYGSDAIVPEIPTKRGFTFNGWNGNYTSVTKDTTITAKWQRNKYNVTFYSGTGSVLDSQRIYFKDAAVEPHAPTMEGYTFQGWDKNFNSVEKDMEIYPIYAWENDDLPVIISDVTAERDSGGYNVSYSLKNAPGQSTQCRLVISLKTSEGKLITYTESTAYNLKEESEVKDTIYVPSQEVASIAEINAVQKFSVVIPIAENQKTAVTGSAFTNWSTEKPPADALKVEERTEYRYRTKSVKETSEKLPSPWVLEKETTGYTQYGAEKRSDTPVAESDTRAVRIETVAHHDLVGYKMVYYCTQENWSPYNRVYRNFSINGNFSAFGARSSYGEHTNTADSQWIKIVSQAQLDSASITPPGAWFEGEQRGINKSSVNGYNFPSDFGIEKTLLWFIDEEVYNDYTSTVYYYKDREKIPMYIYSQLSDYTEWSSKVITESSDKVVEKRTVYRYIPATTNMMENTDGEVRTIAGNVDPSFAGKQAILFVYKIDEAADYTNEAVAQTVIGENGEYDFEFKLREEPTSMISVDGKKPTGDFTVTLGIEGTSSVIYLDPIKAPIPEYTVKYVDYDGELLLSTTVKDGENAPIPEIIPERTGYTFVGWNNNPSEIHSNVTMTAVYVKNTYTVAFVDWNREHIILQQYSYGDPILPPEIEPREGYTFKGWDVLLNEEAIVTQNMVAVAIYEPLELEVTFVDYDDNIISTQMVQYGDNAVLPETLEDQEDCSFMCWSIDEHTIITTSMVVKPVVSYSETAKTPQVSLESDAYNSSQVVKITTSDDSKIYYTLDGTDPGEYGVEYKGEFTISNSCVLKCVAKATNKNNSEIVTRLYAINADDSFTEYMDYDLLPEYVRNNAIEYNVMSTTGYRYSMMMEVTSKNQYDNLIDLGWKVEAETWSEWSEWMTSLNDTTDLMIEQNTKNAEPIEKIFYQYSHWKYFDEETSKYLYSATEIEGVECEYETIDSPERLPVAEFVDGTSLYSYNGQKWFNQAEISKSVVCDEKVYQYRYKTITMSKLSDWVEKLPEEAEMVEKGEVFCYREPKRFILTIKDENGATLYNGLTFANAPIDYDMTRFERNGYNFDGLYTIDNKQWNIAKDVVTDNLVLEAQFTPIQFSVTFVDGDITICERMVDCFGYVTPPEMYGKEGMVFVGWDSNAYMNVTDNVTISAKYISVEKAPTIAAEKSEYYLYKDTQTPLSVQTTNINENAETLIWTSMNPEIVSVDDDGVATARAVGETYVIITEVTTGLMDICSVKVSTEPQESDVYMNGDVNLDGAVNSTDAAMILVYASRVAVGGVDIYIQENVEKEQIALNASDVDKDGEINSTDAAYILTYAALIGSGENVDWETIIGT